MKRLIIASTSTLYNGNYLDYILPELNSFFKDVKTLLFIPFARPGGISHNDYTSKVQEAFNTINIKVEGLHTKTNIPEAILDAEAIFTGGGNTFVLLNNLYSNNCIEALQKAINNGTPYLGTSAGSNICGQNIKTTNDMPIIYPPSFEALKLINFNINPHYLDPNPNSEHMGETRETRIQEFHTQNKIPVIGLREGSWLEVKDSSIILKGKLPARIFEKDKMPYEIETESRIKF
ncbi:dipeptidase PepE [Aurantibacter sp.]|uniref:dipeptidase PepE n=1 Tax=Aurantibacter sp. TaxID=2807103 RepID=UPI0035C7E34B